jgi:hypothetical protein
MLPSMYPCCDDQKLVSRQRRRGPRRWPAHAGRGFWEGAGTCEACAAGVATMAIRRATAAAANVRQPRAILRRLLVLSLEVLQSRATHSLVIPRLHSGARAVYVPARTHALPAWVSPQAVVAAAKVCRHLRHRTRAARGAQPHPQAPSQHGVLRSHHSHCTRKAEPRQWDRSRARTASTLIQEMPAQSLCVRWPTSRAPPRPQRTHARGSKTDIRGADRPTTALR